MTTKIHITELICSSLYSEYKKIDFYHKINSSKYNKIYLSLFCIVLRLTQYILLKIFIIFNIIFYSKFLNKI